MPRDTLTRNDLDQLLDRLRTSSTRVQPTPVRWDSFTAVPVPDENANPVPTISPARIEESIEFTDDSPDDPDEPEYDEDNDEEIEEEEYHEDENYRDDVNWATDDSDSISDDNIGRPTHMNQEGDYKYYEPLLYLGWLGVLYDGQVHYNCGCIYRVNNRRAQVYCDPNNPHPQPKYSQWQNINYYLNDIGLVRATLVVDARVRREWEWEMEVLKSLQFLKKNIQNPHKLSAFVRVAVVNLTQQQTGNSVESIQEALTRYRHEKRKSTK